MITALVAVCCKHVLCYTGLLCTVTAMLGLSTLRPMMLLQVCSRLRLQQSYFKDMGFAGQTVSPDMGRLPQSWECHSRQAEYESPWVRHRQ